MTAATGFQSPVRPQPPPQQPPTPTRRAGAPANQDDVWSDSDGDEEAGNPRDDEVTIDAAGELAVGVRLVGGRLELPIVFTPTSAQVAAGLGRPELSRAERLNGPFATSRTGGRGAALTLAVPKFPFHCAPFIFPTFSI